MPNPRSNVRPRATVRTITIFSAALLIFLRLWFGLSYSMATPAWESYDEPAHFAYAVQIAQTGKLPSDSDPEPNLERIQPPLYYLGLAAFLKVTNSPIAAFKYPEQNPYFYYGTSGANYAIHTLAQKPEEKQIEVSLRFARILTLIFSLFGVAFGIKAGRRAFPKRPGAAFMVAALFALWPQILFNSSVVTNDAPAAVFGALITWQLLSFRRGRAQIGLLLLCLLTLAVGITVKLNILLLIAPVLIAVLFTLSPALITLTFLTGTGLVVGMLFVLRSFPAVLVPVFEQINNQNLFDTLRERFQDSRWFEFVLESLHYALSSSFGLFGWGNVPLPAWVDGLWLIGAVLTGFGILVQFVRVFGRWGKRPLSRPHLFAMLAAMAAVIAGTSLLSILYISIHLAPGRYLLPALTAFLVLMVAAWLTLRLRPLLWGTVIVLTVMGGLVPPLVIAPTYAIPPEVQIADIPHKENVELVPGVRFLGWDIPNQVVYPGQNMEFYLYWQAAYPLYTRFFFKIELIAPDGQGYAILETIPGEGNYLATDWQPRRTFRDHYKMAVRSDYPAPSVGRLRVTVLPSAGFDTYAEFGEIAVHAPTPPQMAIPLEKAARFRDKLALRETRFEFFGTTRLQVYLTWQALDKLPSGTVFIHLLCGLTCAGDPIAQKDIPPRDGSYPLQWWLPGEVVADTYDLRLPEVMKPGQYPLRVGLYDTFTPEHLRWAVDYFGKEDGLLVGWLFVDENNQRRLTYTYPR